MPLWRNIRRLSFLGPVMGVQNPGSFDVIMPAQGVAVLDDATRAVAPPDVPMGASRAATTTSAGHHGGLEFQARAGGLWILRVWQDSATDDNYLFFRADDQAVGARVINPRTATWGVPDGEVPESGINDVQILAAAMPANTVGYRTNDTGGNNYELDIYLRPGERFYIVQFTANQPNNLAVSWQEVPTRERA